MHRKPHKPTLEEKGGLRYLLQADPLEGGVAVPTEQLEALRSILHTRVENLGVISPEVTISGADRLIVELPLATDLEEISLAFTERGYLQLANGFDDPPPIGTYISPGPITGSSTDGSPKWPVIINMEDVEGSTALLAQFSNMPLIRFSMTERGKEKLANFTRLHTGAHLLVVVDGRVRCAPRIYDPLTSGLAEIVGLSFWEAARLVAELKSGPLPIALKVLEARQFPVVSP